MPNTAPHRHDEMEGMRYTRLSPLQMETAMGIKRENVPHAVPVAKESAMPTKKTTAGIICGGMGDERTR